MLAYFTPLPAVATDFSPTYVAPDGASPSP